MVILRGWAEAPLSPSSRDRLGAQSRPIARATTLKAKRPKALLWTAVSTCPGRTGSSSGHQTAQTLLSIQAVGPQQAIHPALTATLHTHSCPAARSLSLALSQEECSGPGFLVTATG